MPKLIQRNLWPVIKHRPAEQRVNVSIVFKWLFCFYFYVTSNEWLTQSECCELYFNPESRRSCDLKKKNGPLGTFLYFFFHFISTFFFQSSHHFKRFGGQTFRTDTSPLRYSQTAGGLLLEGREEAEGHNESVPPRLASPRLAAVRSSAAVPNARHTQLRHTLPQLPRTRRPFIRILHLKC